MKDKFDYKVYNWSIEDGDYERIEEEVSIFSKIKEHIFGESSFLLFLLVFILISVLIITFSF